MSYAPRPQLLRRARPAVLVTAAALLGATTLAPARAAEPVPPKTPVAIGSGGAVSSVDPDATAAGLKVLRQGGNAVDAAVATAAALGVTEPYSAGIGGGGYFVYYDARSKRVSTIDGRETAPATMPHDAFIDPKTGKPYPFTPELVTSGVSVGTPGTAATWAAALESWGTRSLKQALQPAIGIASKGFVVDQTFHDQTNDNKVRFAAFTPTAKLYLPGGDAPSVGTRFKNPDLANTYKLLGDKGTSAFYRGPLAHEIAQSAQHPPKAPDTTLPVPPGYLTEADLKAYDVIHQKPTKVGYRGLDVYGMAPSSSGGSTVGEALNILEKQRLSSMPRDKALHYYLDASALAFADRGAYVGDPAYVDVPLKTLLSDKFAATRACLIKPDKALPTPTAAGSLKGKGCPTATPKTFEDNGKSTTHLTATDRWGNVVSYTLTIEQTGGSGIVVPGRGFLLNNELTDFSTEWKADDPNRIEGGKRPRSSMSPTIVLRHGKPFLAVGSPGGSTIITTVLQTLVNRVDLGMTLPEAIAAPRASHRNNATVTAEPEFITAYDSTLKPYGYTLVKSGDEFTSAAEIGAVAALEFLPHGRVLAAAEPVRRGGGAAGVVNPR
ncbi:gamma-glutamyltransferase [Luteipulveratus mongoliensis]|uniref:Glutathione hydrolase proenzyme n=1 Tax=Luteipulveratus mongoliensis TaxID=571913 RepID=A0A0K1JQ68_9MICO|nr:gamma-glutamyltransferase [Luteipulveratus mongoliensis]AKU18728.1 gamma-glutamyltransferase [Luteipulveratus mongoliensis]